MKSERAWRMRMNALAQSTTVVTPAAIAGSSALRVASSWALTGIERADAAIP